MRDLPLPDAAGLNLRLDGAPPEFVLEVALRECGLPLVSSFGAESAVLLHMAARIDPGARVLFVETGMLFAETLAYQQQLAAQLGLTNVRLLRAAPEEVAARDPAGRLHAADPEACCALRKVAPLDAALAGEAGWITGRKRFHGGRRVDLRVVEAAADGRLIVNPLAHDDAAMLAAYMDRHGLPRHPLSARGFTSIGCAPCTTAAAPSESPRAGRWRGQAKDECGIHFIGGRVVSAPAEDILVRDDGFHPLTVAAEVVLPPDADDAALIAAAGAGTVAVDFPSMTDGRGFTLARRLRAMGFAGVLRATGGLVADQYAMARRVGFDEVQIDDARAARQPEAVWRARADWRAHDHRARLAG